MDVNYEQELAGIRKTLADIKIDIDAVVGFGPNLKKEVVLLQKSVATLADRVEVLASEAQGSLDLTKRSVMAVSYKNRTRVIDKVVKVGKETRKQGKLTRSKLADMECAMNTAIADTEHSIVTRVTKYIHKLIKRRTVVRVERVDAFVTRSAKHASQRVKTITDNGHIGYMRKAVRRTGNAIVAGFSAARGTR